MLLAFLLCTQSPCPSHPVSICVDLGAHADARWICCLRKLHYADSACKGAIKAHLRPFRSNSPWVATNRLFVRLP